MGNIDNRICGVHAVFEALSSGQPIDRIHLSRDVQSGKLKGIIDLARSQDVPVRREEREVIDRLAPGMAHQGVIAVAGQAKYGVFEDLFKSQKTLIVVLDGVEDPHNLGAVMRTAEACGASGVVIPERHAAQITPVVLKASAGAAAHLPVVRVTNLVNAVDQMKDRGYWIVGVDPQGKQAWTDYDYGGPVALVLGGEHRGLRRLVREHCDILVRIPMLGKIESLNISVAAAVVLYEVVRQRSRQN